MKKVDPLAEKLKKLRESVPRDNKGKFGKGNQNALARRTATADKLQILRDTPANMTTKEMSDHAWLTYYVLAVGDLEKGILPVQWAAELFAKRVWLDRHAIVVDERMLKLEADLERIYHENPDLLKSDGQEVQSLGIAGAIAPLEAPNSGTSAPAL